MVETGGAIFNPPGLTPADLLHTLRTKTSTDAWAKPVVITYGTAPEDLGMEWVLNPEIWIALLTLTVLEIVLGIDNIVFISILAGRLPEERQPAARRAGLVAAMVMRILLLLTISWIAGLVRPLFTILRFEVSGRDLVMLAGGLFLIAKATHEIHEKLEGSEEEMKVRIFSSFGAIIAQIMLLDIVFSLDSVITAVGMARHLSVMIAAVVIAVGVMLVAVGPVSRFIEDHPTVKMLALSFLLLIGVSLLAEGLHQDIPRGYIYFAMGFSVFVEFLNLKAQSRVEPPVELRRQLKAPGPAGEAAA